MDEKKPEMILFAEDESSEPVQGWMLTFADLLALLLAFFILLYSMSIITAKQWESMVQSLSHQLNPQYIDDQTDFSAEKAIERIIEKPAMDLDYLDAILREKISQDPILLQNIILQKGEQRLSIFIEKSNLFYESDSSLTEDAQLILYGVGNVLQQVPNRIEIYANSTQEALQSSEFPSHWELSLSRAMVVGEMLKKFGNRSAIQAYGRVSPTYGAGYSESKADLEVLNQMGASSIEIVIRNTVKSMLNHPGS